MADQQTAVARTNRVLNNLSSSVVSKLVTLFLNFVTRSLFIAYLGKTYLSVNGLYSDVLGMLSLAELGFGVSMGFAMYKPLAEKDYGKMSSIMRLYRTVHRVMGTVILVIGLSLIPVLNLIIKIPEDMNLGWLEFSLGAHDFRISYIVLYYIMHLVNTVISYFFNGYKRSILYSDQKTYVSTYLSTALTLGMSVVKVLVLILLADSNPDLSYTIFMLLGTAATIASNIIVGVITKRMYPDIRVRHAEPLPKEEVRRIAKDVGGNAVARICHVALNNTDNILISAMISTLLIGSLSNYTMITGSLSGILTMFTGALTASLGNYFVEKTKREGLELFDNVTFGNDWLYGLCCVCLVTLFNPFMVIWLHNEEYLLGWPIIIAICINFFVAGYMNVLTTFRSALGLFTQGWFRPIIVAVVNIGASIGLAYALRNVTWFGFDGDMWALFGILFATFLARASVNLWYDPIIIHKYGFEASTKSFFLRTLRTVGWTIVLCLVMVPFRLLLPVTLDMPRWQQFLNFGLLMLATACVCVGGFWLINRRHEEYRFFVTRFVGIFRGLTAKLKKKKG